MLIPLPTCSEAGAPPGALWPNLEDGSDGGGPSTEHETMFVPRIMVRPNVRFSSDSTIACAAAEPGAGGADLAAFLLTLRNSSVSARTRFMC